MFILAISECNAPDASNDICSFLHSDEISSHGGQLIQKRLSTEFDIPTLFWTGLCQEASGFFWAKDGSGQYPANHASSNATSFRFLIKHGPSTARAVAPQAHYLWEKLGFASYWSTQRGLVVLCFDVPAEFEAEIGQILVSGDVAKYGQGPFSLHAALMLPIVESFDRAVWGWRDAVRDLEKTRVSQAEDESEKRSFENMHETTRHVIHSSEMLMTAISVAESIAKEVSGLPKHQRDSSYSTIVKDLEFSISLLTTLLNRSQALEKRLENEVNLASRILFASKSRGLCCADM